MPLTSLLIQTMITMVSRTLRTTIRKIPTVSTRLTWRLAEEDFAISKAATEFADTSNYEEYPLYLYRCLLDDEYTFGSGSLIIDRQEWSWVPFQLGNGLDPSKCNMPRRRLMVAETTVTNTWMICSN